MSSKISRFLRNKIVIYFSERKANIECFILQLSAGKTKNRVIKKLESSIPKKNIFLLLRIVRQSPFLLTQFQFIFVDLSVFSFRRRRE